MDIIAKEGATSHPKIAAVWKARKINRVLGDTVVMPWSLGDLDEEWTDVLNSLFDYETRERDVAIAEARAKNAFEQVLAGKRAAHGYRSYLR